MKNNHVTFIRELWLYLGLGELCSDVLAKRLRTDGGLDISNIEDAELITLIERLESNKWDEVAFSFSELIAYYLALGLEMTKEQIVALCFCILVVSITCKDGFADWESQIKHILEGLLCVHERLDTHHTMKLIQLTFG